MPDLEDDDEWEVEEIKDEIQKKGKTSYLVKWKGWPTEYNTWEPEEGMNNAQGAIRAFKRAKEAKETR
jgi:chromodomain protein Y